MSEDVCGDPLRNTSVLQQGRGANTIPSALEQSGECDAWIDERSGALFSYVDLEARVSRCHPLRTIREIVTAALAGLNGPFAALYTAQGRK